MAGTMELSILNRYKRRLLRQMEALESTLSEGAAEDIEKRHNRYMGEVQDRGEESAADSEAEVSSVISVSHAEELVRVRAALQRIDDGTYGVCEDCGDVIGDARLDANPCARRCIDCQSDYERLAL